MGARRAGLGLLVACGLACCAPVRVEGYSGRYLGSLTRYEGAEEVSTTLHTYDVNTHKALARSVEMNLRLAMRYQARLGESDADILGSRYYGDIRSSSWRMRGQFTPWQDLSTGAASPRGRNAQIGLNLAPRSLPQLDLNYQRGDEQSSLGRSLSDDRRVTLSFAPGVLQTSAGYRRVVRDVRESSSADARTVEWKASAGVAPSWRRLGLRSVYEFLATDHRSAARRRESNTHSVDASATWQLARRLSLGGSGFLRRGDTNDNATPQVRDVDERAWGARVGYRMNFGLDLQASREYRQVAVTGGEETSDYGRFRATFRRPLFRRLDFQSGYLKNVDLASGPVPADEIYAQLDGPLRRSLSGRIEVRTTPSNTRQSGRRWRRLAQLRGDATPELHLEATWRRSSAPDSIGPGLTESEWSGTIGFAPESALGGVANLRRMDRTGRIASQERLANFLVTWRSNGRSQVSINWSRRVSSGAVFETRERTFGADLQTWLPGDYRIAASGRQSSGENRTATTTYSVTMEKSF